MASLGIWPLGFGGSPNTEFVQQTAEQFSLGGTPDWAVTAMFVVLTGTTGMLTGVAAAARRGNRLARLPGAGVGTCAAGHPGRGGGRGRVLGQAWGHC
ncbi:hypothetical protein ABQE68_18420 [Mycolicibacterium sp. XJ1904]